MELIVIYMCMQIREYSLLINYICWHGCQFHRMETLFELLKGCPELRVCCDSVEIIKKIESTTRNWRGLRDMDECCRHLSRTRITDVENCLGEMGT